MIKQLGKISTATHRVRLSSPGATEIHAVTYSFDLIAQKTAKEDIEKKTLIKAIDLARIEYPSRNVFVGKKAEPYEFA